MVVLDLSAAFPRLAWVGAEGAIQGVSLPVNLQAMAERISPKGLWSEWEMEQAIAEVEDAVMPWRSRLPDQAAVYGIDPMVAQIAQWAGMPEHASHWTLHTDAVEGLFNRLMARLQGRPATQDALPITGWFAAGVLFLREWLHHLKGDRITILRLPGAEQGGDTPHTQEGG